MKLPGLLAVTTVVCHYACRTNTYSLQAQVQDTITFHRFPRHVLADHVFTFVKHGPLM